jgi:hypothetical protein
MRGPISGGSRGLTIVLILSWLPASLAGAEAYETYDGLREQFTIALPAGWSTYNQNQALSGELSPLGVVVSSALAVRKEGETTADPDLMSRIDTGEIPSFFVDRQPAAKGMSCSKFTKSAAYEVGVKLTKDPIFGAARRYFSATPIKHDAIQVGSCQGFRYKGEGKKGTWILDVRAVSDGKVLYLFSLRNTAENYARNIDTFEKALGSLQLATRE